MIVYTNEQVALQEAVKMAAKYGNPSGPEGVSKVADALYLWLESKKNK